MRYSAIKSALLSATMLMSAGALAAAETQDDEAKVQLAQAGVAAQTAPAAAKPDPKADEKVTVTATRRKTVLQKTPVAVTAISARALESAKIENIEDLTALVPALQVTNGGNPTAFTARIRGVGTQGNNAGLEAAVGTFIDGVYRSRASVAFGDLGEIQAIEVLRGPQGTLFGRNTSAGILNIVTKSPEFTNSAMGEITVGSYDLFGVKGGFNFAPSDQVAFRLFGVRQEQEGFIEVSPGRPDADDGHAKSYWAVRGQMLWQISDAIDLRVIADSANRDDECCNGVTVFPGGNGRAPTVPFPNTSGPAIINYLEAPLIGKATTDQRDNLIAYSNSSTGSSTRDGGVSAELNWDFGGAQLTSITASRHWENDYGQDSDFSGADIIYFPDDGSNVTRFETFTHEMRLTGELPWVNWLVGVFYSNEDIFRHSNLTNGTEAERYLSLHRIGDTDLAVAPFTSLRASLNGTVGHPLATPVVTAGQGQDDTYEQNSESIALFTHNVFHLTEDLDFIAGLRYTSEEKVFDATYRTNGTNGCASVEAVFGLNPSSLAPGPLQGLVGLTCLPGSRHALDVLTAVNPHHQERSEHEFSGVATLAWEVQENLNTYATYSRGHKAGGFNLDRSYADAGGSIVSGPVGAQTVRGPDTSFAAEFVDAFELGLKTNFDSGRLLVNLAVFYQDFENFQLNTFTGVSFIVTSVPEVISQGVELEAFWRTPVPGLTTNLAVQYTDAHYGEIGSLTQPGSFLALNPGLFLLKDAQITHSPDWTVTGGFDYGFPLFSSLAGFIHMDARWQSSMNTGSNLDPRKLQDAFAVVGLKLGVTTQDERFGLEFFARNLFDERYINTAFDAPLQGSSITPTAAATSTIDAFMGEPRMIGVTFKVRD